MPPGPTTTSCCRWSGSCGGGRRATDRYGAQRHEIVHEPQAFPEYHDRFYATFFLDLHGFMVEVVTYEE